MATVGSLMIDIGANVARLDKDMQHVKSSIDGLSTHIKGRLDFAKTWQGMAAGIASVTYMIDRAGAAFNKAWDLAEGAAQYEEMKKGLAGLSAQYGMTADAAIEMAKEAVGGQLSMKEAGDLAAKAFTLGFNPKQFEDFLIQAERLTDVVGGDIPSALEAMERAAAIGRSRGLVAYGIVVDLTKAVDEYARKNGISKTALSEHTLMQIRANAIMEEAKTRTNLMGEATESTADKMNVLKASVADIQLWLGTATIRASMGATASLEWLAAGALTAYAAILQLQSTSALINWKGLNLQPEFARTPQQQANIDAAKKQYEDIADAINAANEAAMALTGKAANNMEAVLASSSQLAAVLNKIPGAKKSGGGKTLSDAEWKNSILPENYIRELELFEERTKENEEFLKDYYKGVYEMRKKDAEFAIDQAQWLMDQQRKVDDVLVEMAKTKEERVLAVENYAFEQRAKRYEEFYQSLFDMANEIQGEAGVGAGKVIGGLKGISDIAAGKDKWSAEADAAYSHYQDMQDLYWTDYETRVQVSDAWNQSTIAAENATAQQRIAICANMFGALSGAMLAFYEVSGQKHRAYFDLMKAFAIAETIMKTIQAAQNAYTWANEWGGPIAGAIAAAVATAAGMARVAQIRAIQPGTATTGSVSKTGGATIIRPEEPVAIAAATAMTAQRNQIINFYIYGNVYDEKKLARELQPYLEQAQNDGVR